MPQGASSAETLVRELYRSLGSGDADVITSAVRRLVASDVVVHEPESMPWGGRHSGVEAFLQMALGFAEPSSPMNPQELSLDTVFVNNGTDSVDVLAAVSFALRGPAEILPMEVLEWFTVRDDHIVAIRIFMRDTAAALRALGLPAVA